MVVHNNNIRNPAQNSASGTNEMPISHARRLWLMQTRYAFPCLAANAREIAEKVERRTAGGMEGGTSDREKGPFNCKQGTGHSRMLEGNTDNITDSKALGLAATKSAAILSSRCSKYMSTFTICILRNNHEVKATAHQTPLICTAAAPLFHQAKYPLISPRSPSTTPLSLSPQS